MSIKTDLNKALHDRIKRNMGERFIEEGWSEVFLGNYYFSSDEQTSLITIRTVLKESFSPVLIDHRVVLPKEVLKDFFRGITISTTPKKATDNMLDAVAADVSEGLAGPVTAKKSRRK